jgi:hypothetical protein
MKVMIRTKLILVFCLITTGYFSQKSIKGIGFLKLGSRTSAVFNLLKIDTETIAKCSTQSATYNFTDKVIELLSDTTTLDKPIYATYSTNARIFHVPSIQLNDEIKIEDVYLTFYFDTLVGIFSDKNSELNQALTTKYGEPVIDLKENSKEYTLGNGTTVTLTDQTFSSTWGNDPEINCLSYLGKYYSTSINPDYISYFNLEYSKIDLKISKESEKIETKIKDRLEQIKKDKLKDF